MGAEYQNTEYESKLKEISFYKLHPEYIAFVGDKFENTGYCKSVRATLFHN